MVSFRNTQFQAILNGVVIADAVSHGQLSQYVSTGFGFCQDTVSNTANMRMAITSDRWCHHIAAQLSSSSEIEKSPCSVPAVTPAPMLPANPIESALLRLPDIWMELEQTLMQLPSEEDMSPRSMLYLTMTALLNQNFPMALRVRRSSQSHKTSAADTFSEAFAIAFDLVFFAEGDFCLSVARSLHADAPLPGIPVLTGLLSACWVGLTGLPLSGQLALTAPTPSLKEWLCDRWCFTDANPLNLWAMELWRQWAGSLTTVSNVAIQPVAKMGDLAPVAKF